MGAAAFGRHVALIAALVAAACGGETSEALDFPAEAGGKTDAFGRSLVGVPAAYLPDLLLGNERITEELEQDLKLRRQAGWMTAYKIVEPVPLLGLIKVVHDHPEVEWPSSAVPLVPRFETWYGVEDVKRMFQKLAGDLTPADRAARTPFGDRAIAEAAVWNAGAAERSDRWPLDRYLAYVREIGDCPPELSADACAAKVAGRLDGAVIGTSRILYSPATAEHMLKSYGGAVACLERLDALALDAAPASEANFTACFDEEASTEAVLVKAQWVRVEPDEELATFDTDAAALTTRLAGRAEWPIAGDRRTTPSPDEIYTIRLKDGSSYRLAGLHIMTKEIRHWQWVTLWWSDTPKEDFGADRPSVFRRLPPVWSNYKMCAVTWFDEKDPLLGKRFAQLPTLAASIDASVAGSGQPSWCSNPYIEHGKGNANTNCIGCHQHGGSTVAHDVDGDGTLDPLDLEKVIDSPLFPSNGRVQLRETFPADYMFSFNHIDDLAGLFRRELEFADVAALDQRVETILGLTGDAASGAALFAGTCAACHGPDGSGSGFAPNLGERVPDREDDELVGTLLRGKGGMPSWAAKFGDQELADLFAHLRATFGRPE
jgi:mono/diheme cytochrome c family protein